MSDAVDKNADLKKKFLDAYREQKIAGYAIKTIDRCRATLTNWLKADPAFKESYEDIKQDITDQVEQIAFKMIGVIPQGSFNPRTVDVTLLKMILSSRNTEYRPDSNNINISMPMTLPVKGLDAASLGALIAPEKDSEKNEAAIVTMQPAKHQSVPEMVSKLKNHDVSAEAEGNA